jgi:hypothetical protein
MNLDHFFHEKSFVLVEIRFFESNFCNNSPIKKKTLGRGHSQNKWAPRPKAERVGYFGGNAPTRPMMALPDVNKKNHHSKKIEKLLWVPDGYHIKTKFNASGTHRVSQ